MTCMDVVFRIAALLLNLPTPREWQMGMSKHERCTQYYSVNAARRQPVEKQCSAMTVLITVLRYCYEQYKSVLA